MSERVLLHLRCAMFGAGSCLPVADPAGPYTGMPESWVSRTISDKTGATKNTDAVCHASEKEKVDFARRTE